MCKLSRFGFAPYVKMINFLFKNSFLEMIKICALVAILGWAQPKWYQGKRFIYSKEPIDIVIPSAEKDYKMLELAVKQIRENIKNIRRIIVISATKPSFEVEWFDETLFPFSKIDVSKALLKNESLDFENDLEPCVKNRIHWYLQQLLKFYAPFVIPDISSNVLIIDSDIIFLNPAVFQDKQDHPCFGIGSEYHPSYFGQMKRLLPGLRRRHENYSGIVHLMLFQKCVLDDLFSLVESRHKEPFWKAWCHCVALEDLAESGGSEYEIYFNFILDRSKDPVTLNVFKWKNESFNDNMEDLELYRREGYHYVACHHYLRKETSK